MGQDDGIDTADVVTQRLRAQIGAGIDEHAGAIIRLDEDGWAQPLVFGIL